MVWSKRSCCRPGRFLSHATRGSFFLAVVSGHRIGKRSRCRIDRLAPARGSTTARYGMPFARRINQSRPSIREEKEKGRLRLPMPTASLNFLGAITEGSSWCRCGSRTGCCAEALVNSCQDRTVSPGSTRAGRQLQARPCLLCDGTSSSPHCLVAWRSRPSHRAEVVCGKYVATMLRSRKRSLALIMSLSPETK